MNTTTYLQKQLANINVIYRSIVEDLTEHEWVARPTLGENMLGYTVWHIPRTQDAHVQTWIRGIPEVVHRDRWAHWGSLRRLGNGVGISMEEADGIARCANRTDVLAYADETHQEISAWLKDLDENDLDKIPDIPQHLAPYPEYQTPSFIEEASDLFDQPIWSQLMRPCIGHVHRHLGELEVVKNILRRR